MLVAFVLMPALAAQSAEFDRGGIVTVNSTGDLGALDPASGSCDTGQAIDGGAPECTLRAAIEVANASESINQIHFDIPGEGVQMIESASSLPTLSQPVAIDGYTQSGAGANTLAMGTDAVLLIHITRGLFVSAGNAVIRGLVITAPGPGISLSGGSGNVVEGNYIGTDPSGTVSAGTSGVGIQIQNSSGNLVGGTTPAARNVIAGNGDHGINVFFGASSGNVFQGNYIGIDATGTIAIPNNGDGIRFDGAGTATIGGPTPVFGTPPGNVISGNQRFGVFMVNAGSEGTVIRGNIVGADATGLARVPNAFHAVYGVRTGDTVIGGLEPGAGNLISGNDNRGIGLEEADHVTIQGNLIGVDITGLAPLFNDSRGIQIQESDYVLVGGVQPSARNVIAGNADHGIRVRHGAGHTVIINNYIGVGIDGETPIGNGTDGIRIQEDSHDTMIGGTESGAANIIASNGGAGVAIVHDAVRNSVLGNAIYDNGGIGIDLAGDGASHNDAGDGNGGPNHMRNFPEILESDIDGGGDLIVVYRVDTDPENAAYPLRVEFFVADQSHTGGRRFLGADDYTEGDHGGTPAAPLAKTMSLGSAAALDVPLGTLLLATSTDFDGNTSEFTITPTQVPIAEVPVAQVELRIEAVYPNPFSSSVAVSFSLPAPGEIELTLYDLMGRRVGRLGGGHFAAGQHTVGVDGLELASGIYALRLTVGDLVVVRPVTVLR